MPPPEPSVGESPLQSRGKSQWPVCPHIQIRLMARLATRHSTRDASHRADHRSDSVRVVDTAIPSVDELARESRARPSDLYFAYLAELRRCLIETQGNPTSIVYYHSLEEELEEAIGRAKSSSGTKACERAEAIRSVDDITLKFQEYCTSVEMAFLRLRGDSMV